MTFRTRVFLTSLAAAVAALLAATLLLSWSVRRDVSERLERHLVTDARLAAALLSRAPNLPRAALDEEVDALSALADARVTLLNAEGRVIADSDIPAPQLASVESQATRPEVRAAAGGAVGVDRRQSSVIGGETVFVAAPVRHLLRPEIAAVRLAAPIDPGNQFAVVWNVGLTGLVAGLVAALALSWITSTLLSRRMQAIADTARRYASGDFTRPTRDPGTGEFGVIARVLDDTVRELGLRAADRALIEAILGGMVEGVLVVNEQGRLQLVNAAARRMLKVADAPEGRHYLEIVRHPDIAAQIGQALQGVRTGGRELQLPLAPGATFMARSAPVSAGPVRGAVLVLHDITDLRRADQIRRDFVANVSHELRTPLTAVRGYVEALTDGVSDPEQSRRFLATIARHTLRMERLVRDLLRLARLDAGQEPLERVPCQLETLFNGIEADLGDTIEERRQSIVHDIASDAAVVPGDPAKLHDAFRNLLENATNYSPEGSTITLASRRTGNRIHITVSDEGPGIPERDLPRVFERFYRVDKARSRGVADPGGTGLGLAIVRHLVELHGGTVSAANRRERGAVITVELDG